MINNKTTKVVTTIFTTEGNRGIRLLRGGRGLKGGLFVAKGKHYGVAGTTSVRSLFATIADGPGFLCDKFCDFAGRRIVSFFRRLNIGAGVRHKRQIFPISSRSSSIVTTFSERLGSLKMTISLRARIERLLYRRSGIYKILLAGKGGVGTSTIVITANNVSCPSANSANSKCHFTGRAKREIARLLPSLMPVRIER